MKLKRFRFVANLFIFCVFFIAIGNFTEKFEGTVKANISAERITEIKIPFLEYDPVIVKR